MTSRGFRSIVFEVIEVLRVLETLKELSTVFYMRFIIIDFRVENIAQGDLPQEQVAYTPYTFRIPVLSPDFSKSSDGGECSFQLRQVFCDSLVGRRALLADFSEHLAVVNDVCYDCLAIVLRNVLRLVAWPGLINIPALKKAYFFVDNLRDFY